MLHLASRGAACRASAEALLARKPVFDDCMLCGECPCTCKRPPKKVAAKKPPKKAATPVPAVAEAPEVAPPVTPVTPTVTPTPPAPRPDPRAAMRAAAARGRAVTPSAQTAPAAASHVTDTVMEDAIRALAPILHHVEKVAHRHVLAANKASAERAAAWRERRRQVVQ